MRERPILMPGDMVKAILDLRKTQTRRVVKPQPKRGERIGCYTEDGTNKKDWVLADRFGDPIDAECPQCPYGQVGDHLWVRETFSIDDYSGDGVYSGRGNVVFYRATDHKSCGQPWRPSIFMPRFASRITLIITDIRTERLQDITHKDALAEGVSYDVSKEGGSPIERYKTLWDSINGKNHPWDSNPWVWVIKFAVWDDKSAALPAGAEVV